MVGEKPAILLSQFSRSRCHSLDQETGIALAKETGTALAKETGIALAKIGIALAKETGLTLAKVGNWNSTGQGRKPETHTGHVVFVKFTS